MSKVAVSFTHIIKSGEPAFSVLVSRFVLGEILSPLLNRNYITIAFSQVFVLSSCSFK
ncbi:hypothetical protein GW17_00061105 [Ensete ventricosum]|nr:hypothetical protein GW17_00061105 [Ensete ventricosum]